MPYNLPNVRDHIRAVAESVGRMFGITTIGGWRPKDPYPDHPGGYALDFMTVNGQALAQYLVDNAAAMNTHYVIWNRKIWNADRGDKPGTPWSQWRAYTGSNPHIDHVHYTGWPTPRTNGWTNLSNTVGGAVQTAVGKTFDVDKLMGRVEGTSTTLLAGLLGVSLIGAGIFLAVRPKLMKSGGK